MSPTSSSSKAKTRHSLATEMLEKTVVLGRDDIARAVGESVATHHAFQGANVCLLGSAKDSSALFSNFVLDSEHDLQLLPLERALRQRAPDTFYRDFVGTGNQAIDILEAWTDSPRSNDLGEERGEPLPPTLISRFKEKAVAFVFAAGLDGGVTHLEERAAELGLSCTVEVSRHEADIPTLKSAIGDRTGFDNFRTYCRAKAKVLLGQSQR